MQEAELRALAAAVGIDLVGWCEMAPFPRYLEAIATRPEYHRFDYRPAAEFVAAGEAQSALPRVLVLVVDYYHELAHGAGLRLSNYSRFCWDTILPRADEVMVQVRAAGYRIERIDLPARAAACRAGLGTI
ncbi:MAG: hypothetical protein QME94_10985, partial [Anaerolineae bacterium]|nr:hypothetical protein [Anaerolineae bacterium]